MVGQTSDLAAFPLLSTLVLQPRGNHLLVSEKMLDRSFTGFLNQNLIICLYKADKQKKHFCHCHDVFLMMLAHLHLQSAF